MTERTSRLRDLPPHLRLLAWPALTGAGEVPGVTVTVPGELTGQPPSLLCSSDGVQVTLPGDDEATDTATLVDTAGSDLLAVPARLVCALVLWDEVVREQGIFGGNIYLASERSVSRLLSIAGEEVPRDLGEVLHQMQNLELLYRFPVALKFRGAHGRERQCRANGWGRLVYRLVSATPAGQTTIAPWRELLIAHVREHRGVYKEGVELAARARDDTEPKVWDRIIDTQPIPVLI